MNLFENRVESFRNNTVKWPHTGKPHNKIEMFAHAGFYFVRRPKTSDSVRCFLCDIELSHWKPGQSPFTRHATESPNCPWTILNFPDAPQRSLLGYDVTTQPRSATMRAARLGTFNNHNYWPPNKGRLVSRKFQSPSKLADAGFYYSPNLDHIARVKCPYCKASISLPEKHLNVLEKHKELDSACIFFEQTHNIRSSKRRDTVMSSTSTETFKTASSELDRDHSPESATNPVKRKNKEIASEPNKKQIKTSPENEESNEDSFWDIKNAFTKTVTPSQMRKPAITFGKKPTARDRQRTRMLHSDAKQAGTVNIFSPASIKAQPSSLIVKPNKKEIPAKTEPTKKKVFAKNPMPKPTLQAKAVSSVPKSSSPSPLPQQSKITSPKPPLETEDVSQVISHSKSVSDENEIPDNAVVTIPKKDKGKGRAFEPSFITSPYSTKKRISLSKSKPTTTTTTTIKYTPALSPLAETSFTMRSPPLDSSCSNNIPSYAPINEPTSSRPSNVNVYSPTRAQSSNDPITSSTKHGSIQMETQVVDKDLPQTQTNMDPITLSPKRSALQMEPTNFDTMNLPQTPASRAIIAQKIKYLQSTPVQSTTSQEQQQQQHTVNATDIFGDCLYSPIVPISYNKGDDDNDRAIFQSTPVITSGRTRHIIDMATDEEEVTDERENKRQCRAISPPKSPTMRHHATSTETHPPVLSMDQIVTQMPMGLVTEEEKNMTVEDYLQHVIDMNIAKIREHGDKLIGNIEEKCNQIKSQLLQ